MKGNNMKKLMLSLVAIFAIAGIPQKSQAISGGAAAGIGIGAFFGGLVIANALCCNSCCKKCSNKKCTCDKKEKKSNRRESKKTRKARKAAAAGA